MSLQNIIKKVIKENYFWTNGEPTDKLSLEINISKLQQITQNNNITSAYIFGSFAKIQNKKYILNIPHDIDIYLRTNELITDIILIKKIKSAANELTWPGKLKAHIQIGTTHPILDHYLKVTDTYKII